MQNRTWKPGWLALLRLKRRQGMSAGTIASQMSEELHATFTRNAIIGKLNRERIPAPQKSKEVIMPNPSPAPPSPPLPLPTPTSTPMPEPSPMSTPAPEPAAMPAPTASPAATPTPTTTTALVLVPPAEPPPLPCRLLDLPPDTCRWPVNEPTTWKEPHLFCGQPASRRVPPYCEEHYAASVQHYRWREVTVPEDQ
jgi:hypothetical protein